MQQSLQHGNPIQTKYEGLGGQTTPVLIPAAYSTSFLFGMSNSGKSALIQSNPDAYVFNLDATSTVTPTSKAVLWPRIAPAAAGLFIDDSGVPFVFRYEHMAEKVAKLIELAQQNKPRPKTVCFDSLTAWQRMLVEYIPRNAKTLGISANNDLQWKDLHGPAAWDLLYESIINTIISLRNAGYGVYVVGHITRRWIPINENQHKLEFEFTITDNFWKRLVPIFQLSACMATEKGVTTERKVTKVMANGKEHEVTKDVNTETTNHYLYFKRDDLINMTKGRVVSSKILIPKDNAWAAFESAYDSSPV